MNPLYCPSNGNCIINPMTRKICTKCRLEKCLAVGMRKITNNTLDNDLMSITKVKQKCENTTIVPMFREITDYNGLNELETNRLSELSSAAVVFDYKMSNNIRQVNNLEEMLRECGPRQDGSVVDMVNFAKSLSTFNRICCEDRVALLKYGYDDLMSIRTLKFFNKDKETFYIPLDESNTIELTAITRTTTMSTIEIPLGI
ncbi:unnamed protein product [Medioppia subpectinata]|uniref:Nuclear receptor domain-containing protein n=1 Tax=Medioppia subpectinata TaxID=1979941 RepID=A0A7R9KEG6_9ACAR|nr:unnamed protein product [Medioppia subpectinata]CAG2101854.1 unnamed protein product [Medioppia subpectinata]